MLPAGSTRYVPHVLDHLAILLNIILACLDTYWDLSDQTVA